MSKFLDSSPQQASWHWHNLMSGTRLPWLWHQLPIRTFPPRCGQFHNYTAWDVFWWSLPISDFSWFFYFSLRSFLLKQVALLTVDPQHQAGTRAVGRPMRRRGSGVSKSFLGSKVWRRGEEECHGWGFLRAWTNKKGRDPRKKTCFFFWSTKNLGISGYH